MTEEWCCEKLENLKIKENRLSTLEEIRGRLNETPNLASKVTNRLLTSPEIYDCLEVEDDEAPVDASADPMNLVSDILSICMSNLSLRQNDLPKLLDRALQHKRPRIRALALNAILKELENQISDDNMGDAISDDLLRHLLRALQEPETQLGSPALKILTIVLEDHLEKPFIKDTFLEALKGSEVVKCRLYELAVNLSKGSAATLEKVGFVLDHALSELDNDDVLLQVNILEILASLAEQNHGITFLEKQQVFDVISKKVELIEQNPLDRLLVPGIMKFFGKISSIQPQKIITGYPRMIQCLFECLHSGDVSLLPAAFDTLANLCQSQQGVVLLEEHYSNDVKESLEDYSSYLRNLPSELKNRAFSSLEIIFTFDEPVSNNVSDILRKWFGHLNGGEKHMQFLMDFCRNPFPDIKISTLNLIGAACLYPWGIETLKNTAGFLEYLLDRKIEFDKEAKYAKYCVIKILAESCAFDVETNNQLRTYVNEGPYYVQSIMDVAVEGN
ncbi:26S proteasome non-ATPase regulatory subunit 5-like [Musca domestica]|uniref:26S proteasome non-ATPase regulatory subunit 5 n=1 Tax=Musca domestica TaxID=7370 RepID=A0ABM3VD22_MUSDO|nr:26S proteasome non-ATPase regulatory subunit 5-like [Musca domestica]